MAITVKHKFVSAIPDSGDTNIVQPSNWNDDHELAGTIPVANGGTGASDAATARTNLGAAASGNNSDITSMSGITGTIGTPTAIQMDNGNSQTLVAGKMWYTPNTGAWNLGMGGGNITQQVGEELFIYGKASAAITDSPLQIIYHTGTVGASGVIKFAPTIAGITDENAIIGVATEAIALNGFGRITSYGVIHGINTSGSAVGETWADDDVIWYNPVTGNPTKVKPVAPNIKIQVGIVISAGSGSSGSFQVLLQAGTQLGGTDSNVQITTPINGNLLTYDNGNGYWKNTDLTAGTGISVSKSANGVLTVTNTSPSSGGTVTSVSGTAPVSVATGTTTPVISLASGYGDTQNPYASKTANYFLSAPNGIAGVPTFRAMVAADVPTLNQNTTGSAATLTTGRTIAITGDLTYTSPSFNGSANVTAAGTLATVNSNVGTFTKVTVNAKGLTTAASQASLTDLSSPTASFSFGSKNLTNLLDPVNAQDGATKNYVDSVAQGLDAKASVICATTANITLSGTQTIDGIAVVAGNRVLVKNQTAPAENGIYVASASAWARSTDMDTWAEVPNSYVWVETGTTQADTGWVCTSNAGGTIGVTAITWVQFAGAGSYTAGTGLTLTGTQFSITNTGTAGTYGSATLIPVITTNAQGQVTSVTTAANPQGTVTSITAGTGLSGGTITSSGTIAIANTTVTAGSYTNASLTVDAQGRLTAASSGTAPVTSVTATSPVVSSGGTTPAISMPAATSLVSGYLTSTDWTTFNNKGSGTVTSVTATSPVTSTGGTTPVIAMPAATGSVNGYLTSTDWTTFNSKAPSVTYTTNYVPYGQGTTTPALSANFTYDPSLKNLIAPQIRASNGIVVNSKTVSANFTIASGDSAMSAGPITVSSGVTVTVSSGSKWVVL